jgi:hypothetical protein
MKMSRRHWFAVGLVLVIALAAIPAFFQWKAYVVRAQQVRALRSIENLVAKGDHALARTGLQGYLRQDGHQLSPELRAEWAKLDFSISEKLRDLPRLLYLFQREPTLIANSEATTLLVLRALAAMRETDAVESLREGWRGRERLASLWCAFDADQLMARNRAADARTLLESHRFAGAEDSGRLVRLALLSSGDPAKQVRYMEEAYAADPKNPDVRSFRGQILESAGQIELARVEYVAALVAEPRDAMRRDQLAAFYVRTGSFEAALTTYGEALGPETPDFLWLQWRFWGLMVRPPPKNDQPVPPGRLAPLAEMLGRLPPDRFWVPEEADRMPEAAQLQERRQETYWLRLFQLLKEGKETQAAELLAASRFRGNTYEPELESALKIVLRYRASKRAPHVGDLVQRRQTAARHTLHEQIREWSGGILGRERSLSAETDAFLRGDRAFAGLALAAGWREAALRLVDVGGDFTQEPAWFRFGLAQALRFNRSPDEALAFLRRGGDDPATRLLQGEILLARKEIEAATQLLAPLAKETSEPAFRAAWLLATHALEQRAFARARECVLEQPALRAHALGRELLARTAILSGDEPEAKRIYESLGADSIEAATFLARRSFAARDWTAARRWTEALIARLPDEMQLRANLAAIDTEQAKEKERKP